MLLRPGVRPTCRPRAGHAPRPPVRLLCPPHLEAETTEPLFLVLAGPPAPQREDARVPAEGWRPLNRPGRVFWPVLLPSLVFLWFGHLVFKKLATLTLHFALPHPHPCEKTTRSWIVL